MNDDASGDPPRGAAPPPQPEPLRWPCPACGTTHPLDTDTLDFTFVETWEPSLVVIDIYHALLRCPCGATHRIELHRGDGLGPFATFVLP
jgi:hypothetical protein